MKEEKPWHEDHTFWDLLGPILFTERRWGLVPEEVDGIVELASLRTGEKVLDLCCGPGRHSLELARRGFVVTGVDRTLPYLERAKAAAEKEGLSVEFVHDDMRSFRRPGAFDGAISYYTSFGYFSDAAEERRVLENLFSSLAPGGRLLMELIGREVLARIFKERDWLDIDGTFLLEERKVEEDWTWINNRWIVFKNGKKKEFLLNMRLYSAAELKASLESAGFESVSSYGDITGTPYDHTAKRLIVTAKKPE
ncbi:MAG: class I SAM-dependent methyltransferase [Candidatus Eiseniibacteriota bacterium]|nr:MAG: class I SAM-dependent methyltransferase [Candidatus Eisenbacteria bacterium]